MITPSQQILLEAVKASVFRITPNYHSIVNWDEVVAEAKSQTVMSLISSVIPVKDNTCEQCKAMYMRIMYEQDKLIKCLDNAQIPFVILKGSAAAVYYPMPHLRTMGDVDVLVPQARFAETLQLLEDNGYIYGCGSEESVKDYDDVRDLAYIKNGVCVEIHKRFSSPGFNVDDILESAIERREYFELNGYRFPILPCAENGLVLLGHINHHLKDNALGLRQIIDWAMYLNAVKDIDSWIKEFVPLVEKVGLLTLAAYVTKVCNKHLGLPEKVCFDIDVEDSLVDELIEVVLTDANFGRRVHLDNTEEEKKLLSASVRIEKEGIFHYFIRIGLENSNFCKTHPSLKVIAFLCGFFRQLRRGINALIKNKGIGKNMRDGKKIFEMRSNRQDLYKKLGVRNGK